MPCSMGTRYFEHIQDDTSVQSQYNLERRSKPPGHWFPYTDCLVHTERDDMDFEGQELIKEKHIYINYH